MAFGISSDEHKSKTVKRYSSLFSLPSHRRIVILIYAICLTGGILAVLLFNPSPYGIGQGLMFGTVFFFFTLLSDLIIYNTFLKTDPIFNLRRCSGLSLYSSLTWFGFIFLVSVVSVVLKSPDLWIRFCLLGFFSAFLLRLLVLSTTSFAGLGKGFISSLLQPILCIIPLLSISSIIGYDLQIHRLLLFLLISIFIAVLTAYLFVFFVNRVGRKSLGVDSLLIFKAFMANWTEDLDTPLESLFEKFGHEQAVKLSLLAFRANKKIKSLILVPSFHPGPFKNVGSSQFPSMIQDTLENKLQCTVSVPHGLSSHDLDLSSKLQCQKIAKIILDSIDFSSFDSKATPFMRTKMNGAKASCQIFGNCVLLALTLSPKTMEDLPQVLDHMIVNEAEKRKLSSAIVIDAHNCIEGPFNPNVAVESLKAAAVASLEQTLALPPSPYEIGTAKLIPEEFTIKDGMGPGGITVIVTRVGEQKTAYITVDGNNMMSGLRDKILSALLEIGIIDGEVFTTDTHMVCGVVPTPRGYYPIGEVMDKVKLVDYVRQATVKALNDLEPAEASWCTKISNVKVIGEKQIESFCLLAEETAKQAKRLAVLLFPITSVLLTTLLLLI